MGRCVKCGQLVMKQTHFDACGIFCAGETQEIVAVKAEIAKLKADYEQLRADVRKAIKLLVADEPDYDFHGAMRLLFPITGKAAPDLPIKRLSWSEFVALCQSEEEGE